MLQANSERLRDVGVVNKDKMLGYRKQIFKKRKYEMQRFVRCAQTLCHPVRPSMVYPRLSAMVKENQEATLYSILQTPYSDDHEEMDHESFFWWQEINRQDFLHRTALHEATEMGLSGIMTILIEHGADPNLVDSKGQSCIHFAARKGHFDSLLLLLEVSDPDLINAKDLSGNTALHVALLHNQYSVALKLLVHGADYSIVNNFGNSALKMATYIDLFDFQRVWEDNDELNAFLHLLKASSNLLHFLLNINRVQVDKNCEMTTEGAVLKLLASKSVGLTCLHQLVLSDNYQVLERLLKAVEISTEDKLELFTTVDSRRQTVIHIAALRGNIKAIRLIFMHCQGYEELLASALDRMDRSPILLAASNSHWEVVEYLSQYVTPERFSNIYISKTGENVLRFSAISAPMSIFSLLSNLLDSEKILPSHSSSEGGLTISGLLSLSVLFHRMDLLQECPLTDVLINSREGEEQSTRYRPLICLAFDLERWEMLKRFLSHKPYPDLTLTDNRGRNIIHRFLLSNRNSSVISLLPLLLENPSLPAALHDENALTPAQFVYKVGGCKLAPTVATKALEEVRCGLWSVSFIYSLLCMELQETSLEYVREIVRTSEQVALSHYAEDTSHVFYDSTVLLYMAHLAPNVDSSSKSHKKRMKWTRSLVLWLIPLSDISSANAIVILCKKGYWHEAKCLFEHLPTRFWDTEKGKSILLLASQYCIMKDQVGMIRIFHPKISSCFEEFLPLALSRGSGRVFTWMLASTPLIIRNETYGGFIRNPIRPVEPFYIANTNDKVFFCPDDPCKLPAIVLETIVVWKRWNCAEAYSKLNFLQMCAITGSAKILLFTLSLLDSNTKDIYINQFHLIAFSLQYGCNTLGKHLTEILENPLAYKPQNNDTSPIAHALCFAVRQTEEPTLVSMLLAKKDALLRTEDSYQIQYATHPVLWYCIPVRSYLRVSMSNESFVNMTFYVKRILAESSVEERVCFLCQGPFLVDLIRCAPLHLGSPKAIEIEELATWLISTYPDDVRTSLGNHLMFNSPSGLDKGISKGYWKVIESLFSNHILAVDEQPASAIEFLFNQALGQQQMKAVSLLCSLGFDLAAITLRSTSLHNATRHSEICQCLLTNGLPVSQIMQCATVFHHLQVSVFQRLLSVHEKTSTEISFMRHVAAYASIEVFRTALQSPLLQGKWMSFCYNGRNLLMEAALHGNYPVVREILVSGSCDPERMSNLRNQRNNDGNTILHVAAISGNLETVRLLADEYLASVVNKRGHNSAYEAWVRGHCHIVDYFRRELSTGVVKYHKELTPRVMSRGYGWFRLLMQINKVEGEPYDERTDFIWEPYSFPLVKNVAKAKLMAGIPDMKKFLHTAIVENRSSTVAYLLENESRAIERIILEKQFEAEPLLLAASRGLKPLTCMILKFYESMRAFSFDLIQRVDSQKNTLLHWAAAHSWQDLAMEIADKYSLSWNQENANNETPMCLAVCFGKFQFPPALERDASAFVDNYMRKHGNIRYCETLQQLKSPNVLIL